MMRKEYISPAIKLLVIDELCSIGNASVVSTKNNSDVVIDGFGVVEDTSEEDEKWWDNADNWGGS